MDGSTMRACPLAESADDGAPIGELPPSLSVVVAPGSPATSHGRPSHRGGSSFHRRRLGAGGTLVTSASGTPRGGLRSPPAVSTSRSSQPAGGWAVGVL